MENNLSPFLFLMLRFVGFTIQKLTVVKELRQKEVQVLQQKKKENS
jgi:hypothetical protein